MHVLHTLDAPIYSWQAAPGNYIHFALFLAVPKWPCHWDKTIRNLHSLSWLSVQEFTGWEDG